MGIGIGEYCKRCGEQLTCLDWFDDGLCDRCNRIIRYEKEISFEPEESEHTKLHKEVFCKTTEWEYELARILDKYFSLELDGGYEKLEDFIKDLLGEKK